MSRIRTWRHAVLAGIVLGTVACGLYVALLALLPGVAGRVWLASLAGGGPLVGGAVLGLAYGAAAGAAVAVALAADLRCGRQASTGVETRVGAAVAGVIGVVLAFLVLELGAWVVLQEVDLSDLTLVLLVAVPAAAAAVVAAALSGGQLRRVSARDELAARPERDASDPPAPGIAA